MYDLFLRIRIFILAEDFNSSGASSVMELLYFRHSETTDKATC